MHLRNRTLKMVLMDFVKYLRSKDTPISTTLAKVESVINDGVEQGLCTSKMMDTLTKFVNKQYRVADPSMLLHCAVTLETLSELGGTNNTDVTVLPEELQEAAECGPECMGSERPSVERLIYGATDDKQRLYAVVGGSLCNQIMSKLTSSLDVDYVKSRS